MYKSIVLLFLILLPLVSKAEQVLVGIDLLSKSRSMALLKEKRIGLITNHTAVNGSMRSTLDILKDLSRPNRFSITAIFAPEHGITGSAYAGENVNFSRTSDGIPIYSLFGKQQRPTPEMLKNVDLLIYDMQDIGSRSYTYIAILFYTMEEAAKAQIPIIVLDRPNPINGCVIDGPMLEAKWRSIVGYINVPYCHGMTVGELARFFNSEYQIGCNLEVVPMENWNRKMSYIDTGLSWIPTSPNIPESTTPLFYPMTGILGELSIVSIGIGYTLPFKVVGAPWINAEAFAKALNDQKFPGIHFHPFHFKPLAGKFIQEECHGALIYITDPLTYQPVASQYLIIGVLKNLYPQKMAEALKANRNHKEMFCKVNGNEEAYRLITEEKNITWKLRGYQQAERQKFIQQRRRYLLYPEN